jgi:hypothetical protein
MGWCGVFGMTAAGNGDDFGVLTAVRPGMAPVLVAHIGV